MLKNYTGIKRKDPSDTARLFDMLSEPFAVPALDGVDTR